MKRNTEGMGLQTVNYKADSYRMEWRASRCESQFRRRLQLWVQEVVGSNPAAPIRQRHLAAEHTSRMRWMLNVSLEQATTRDRAAGRGGSNGWPPQFARRLPSTLARAPRRRRRPAPILPPSTGDEPSPSGTRPFVHLSSYRQYRQVRLPNPPSRFAHSFRSPSRNGSHYICGRTRRIDADQYASLTFALRIFAKRDDR